MTQPQDPRHAPLQDDEIALARVLRALPAGEPSAKVDAAILAAATDAVNGAAAPAAPSSPRRAVKAARWALPGWAIGTAAAAVLAIGVGMQLRPPLAPEPRAASAERASEAPAARDEVSVELVDPQERKVLPTAPPPTPAPQTYERPGRAPPPPPPPPPVVQSAPPAPVAEVAEAFPMPAAEPAPPPEVDASTLDSIEVTGSRVRTPAESGDHARRAHQAAYANRAQREAAAKLEAQADQAVAEAEARGESLRERQAEARSDDALAAPAAAAPAPPSVSDTAAGAGARDTAPAAAVLPPVADDTLLAPREWLERIRERLRQGDRAGARASLLQFVQAHPDAPVPTDLDRLR